MQLYLLRHGETELNKEGRLQGQVDCPLNDMGIRQAEEAGRRREAFGICFDRVYSSPLQRAVDTAVPASGFPKEDIRITKDLLEAGYGPFEAKKFEELTPEMWAWIKDPEHVRPPEGVESIFALLERTGRFLKEMKALPEETNVLAVTHGVAMRALLRCIPGAREDVWGMDIDNCTLYMIELAGDSFGPVTKIG